MAVRDPMAEAWLRFLLAALGGFLTLNGLHVCNDLFHRYPFLNFGIFLQICRSECLTHPCIRVFRSSPFLIRKVGILIFRLSLVAMVFLPVARYSSPTRIIIPSNHR